MKPKIGMRKMGQGSGRRNDGHKNPHNPKNGTGSRPCLSPTAGMDEGTIQIDKKNRPERKDEQQGINRIHASRSFRFFCERMTRKPAMIMITASKFQTRS